MPEYIVYIRELGSFGMMVYLFIVGVRYVPRAVVAMERTCDAVTLTQTIVTRLEAKVENSLRLIGGR